jgi:L-alanine-DL-glutamate epimerase-like enolase superfamily enzyme
MRSDVKVVDVRTHLVDTRCRTPLKFGAVVVERLPIGYARATVETEEGRTAEGWGAMFLMDLWAWPISKASHEAKGRAMCELLDAYAGLVAGFGRHAHPIEIFMETEGELNRLSREVAARFTPEDEMPFLAALVAASPVDHAVHDAFGKANGIDSYLGYGPERMSFDLSRYLGHEYAGVWPSQFLRQSYLPRLPVFHLVGGLDVLRRGDVPEGLPDDGIPNSLDDWIARDGVFCLKVKLKGTDVSWDVARTADVSRIYHEVRDGRRPELPARPFLTADTNEQCESPEYVVEYLAKLREADPRAFDEVLYVEQPTERDLTAHRWDMRPISKIRPVLIDESLTSVEDFRLAMELGWSGIALKSCKCLSADLLFVPMAELAGVPYAVQDLTNPSIALVESVGLAARTHTIMGVEANSRQFFPEANELVAKAHGNVCRVRDGLARTASIRGPGLGLRVEDVPGFVESVEAADREFRSGLDG